MARTAKARTTQLAKEEIAQAALDLFDGADGEFSMRTLARRLQVTPGAIYYHYENQGVIVDAAVALVWEESVVDFFSQVADPINAPDDPIEILIMAALCARRAFDRHYRIAPNLALPPPENDQRLSGGLAIFGTFLENAGIGPSLIGEVLYAYTTYSLGAILYRAHRRLAAERLGRSPGVPEFSSVAARPVDAPTPAPQTLQQLDRTIAITVSDGEAEERLFVSGLRTLLMAYVERAALEADGAGHRKAAR